jgi:glucose/arabinose dehydrogenase
MKWHNPSVLLVNFLMTFIFFSCKKNSDDGMMTPFASGLDNPVCIANAGDNRLFVANQTGTVVIVDSAGKVNPVPFIDLSDKAVYGGEKGLLGIAFHPAYQTNGYFYVNYTGEGDSTHISRFCLSTQNPNKADSLSEMRLLTIEQPYPNHNGGNLCFGPDGYLYIGLGDGGSAGDPGNRSQNPKDLHGKMLRIDVDHGNPYAIPESNPFFDDPSVHGEIWAMGLRNPWKYSFDRLTGDLWIADVGQDVLEEINFQEASGGGGENYGWRCYEGNQPFNTDDCGPLSSYTFPVYTYSHGSECSVTGGYVYRGLPSSPFYGYYFFADYCSDRIWIMRYESNNWTAQEFGQFPGNNFTTFGEDASGRLYLAGHTSGNLYRLSDYFTGDPRMSQN